MEIIRRSAPEQIRGRSEFLFFYALHGCNSSDVGKIARLAGTKEAIILEYVGGTPKDRREDLRKFHLVLSSAGNTLNSSDRQTRQETILKMNGLPYFAPQLVLELAGSNKHLYFVDLDETHPKYKTIEQHTSAGQQKVSQMLEGNFIGALKTYKTQLALEVRSAMEREVVVTDQIKRIVFSGPETKFLIVQGVFHVPIYEAFRKKYGSVHDIHIHNEHGQQYIPGGRLRHELRKFSLMKISDVEYKREFLAGAVFLEAIGARTQRYVHETASLEAAQFGHTLTVDQVEWAWNRIQKIYIPMMNSSYSKRNAFRQASIQLMGELEASVG